MEQPKKIDLINIRNNHQISLTDGKPTVAEEWHPFLNDDFKPEHFSCGSEKEVWWLGKCGHEWKTKIFVRALHDSGCPYCSNKKVLTGFNDLESKYPDVAKTWHPTKNADITPSTILYSTEKKVWWMCEKGHEYEASVFSRTINQSRCPYCSNKEILKGFNDLESHFPNVAKEWHPTKNIGLVDGNGKDISTPDKVVFGATHKVWWIGSCGHEYEARICHRTVYNSGCPYCDGKKVLPGFNDLETKYPEVAKSWHPTLNGDLKPTDVVARGQHKPWWLCPKGHSYQSSLGSRTDGCGCPICDGKQVLKGFNDLESKYPDIAKQWHPTKNGKLKPADVIAGTKKRVWWICERGHDYRTSVQQRTLQGCGCPICNESRGEKATRNILLQNNISFKEQHVFNDRKSSLGGILRDDFAIIHKDNVAATIEYHGKQHYEVVDFSGHNPDKAKKSFNDTKIRDADKTKYLHEHNIPQLIIPYWEYDNIEQVVTDFLKERGLINEQ